MKRWMNLPVLLACGLIARIAVAIFLGDRFIWSDEQLDYYPQAYRLSQGMGWGEVYNILPAFPFLMSLTFHVTQGDIVGTRLVLAVLNSGLILAVYALAKTLFDERTGRIAAVFAAVYPIVAFSSALILPEIPFAILICLGLTFLVTKDRRPRNLALAGLFFGLASVFISLTLPFLILSTAILLFGRQETPWKRRWLPVAVYVGAFLAFTTLWGFRNLKETGEFLTVKGNYGAVLYLHNNPYASGFSRKDNSINFKARVRPLLEKELEGKLGRERDKVFRDQALTFIRENPGRFARLCFERFLNLWRFTPETISETRFTSNLFAWISILTYGPLFGLALFGLFKSRRGWRRQCFVYAYILSLILIFTVTRSSLRARLPLEPLLVIYAAYGARHLFPKDSLKEATDEGPDSGN